VRWRRWRETQNGWFFYGWFTGLSCLGSVAGAISFGARVGQFSQRYPRQRQEQLANKTLAVSLRVSELRSIELSFAAAHFVFFSLELGLITAAQLLVLHRMQKFSFGRKLRAGILAKVNRVFLVSVIVVNLVGASSTWAAAVFLGDSVTFSIRAVNAYADANVDVADAYRLQAKASESKGAFVLGVQRWCEVCVLLAIVMAFTIVGVTSHRIIAAALRTLLRLQSKMRSLPNSADAQSAGMPNKDIDLLAQASTKGKLLQRKIVCTFLFLFLTLLVRSIFSVMYALALALNEISNPCSPSECSPCKNVFSHILSWILYTPQFQQATMIIASPLSQLVALWGMSGVRSIEQMVEQQANLDARRTTSPAPQGHQP
jgi:hypothetical protein